jgi:hypothetical protein
MWLDPRTRRLCNSRDPLLLESCNVPRPESMLITSPNADHRWNLNAPRSKAGRGLTKYKDLYNRSESFHQQSAILHSYAALTSARPASRPTHGQVHQDRLSPVMLPFLAPPHLQYQNHRVEEMSQHFHPQNVCILVPYSSTAGMQSPFLASQMGFDRSATIFQYAPAQRFWPSQNFTHLNPRANVHLLQHQRLSLRAPEPMPLDQKSRVCMY